MKVVESICCSLSSQLGQHCPGLVIRASFGLQIGFGQSVRRHRLPLDVHMQDLHESSSHVAFNCILINKTELICLRGQFDISKHYYLILSSIINACRLHLLDGRTIQTTVVSHCLVLGSTLQHRTSVSATHGSAVSASALCGTVIDHELLAVRMESFTQNTFTR